MSDWKVVVPTATQNMTRNPSGEESVLVGSALGANLGFETAGAGDPDFWTVWTETAGDGTIADEGVLVNAGSHAAKLTSGATSNTNIYQAVTVEPGKLYRATFYTRGDGTYAGRFNFYDVTNAANITAVTSTAVTGATYTQVEACFVAPALCVSATLTLHCPGTDTGVAYFDTVTIQEANIGAWMATGAVSTAASFYGAYCVYFATDADDEGVVFALETLSNAAHYVTMMVKDPQPTAWDWSLDDSTYTAPTKIYDIDADWDMYGCTFVAGQANGSTALYVRQNGGTATTLTLDAVQVEAASAWTTYCDGDQPGCEWDGKAHDSSSSRSAVSRAGGTVYDLEDDYGLLVEGYIGTGMAPRATSTSGYSGLPGGALNNSVRTMRPFTLVSFINSTSYEDLLDKRNALADILSPESYPATADGWQPVTLWHTGATTYKQIQAHYETGLGADQTNRLPIHERVAIRFLAPDPNWYELGESAQVLDVSDTVEFFHMAARLKSTGQWDDMGITAVPAGGAGACTIYAMCVASDKSVYVGGSFDGLNNDSPAGMDYIGRYIPTSDSWQVLVGASDLGGAVYVIKEGPDGLIYVGGAFVNVNAVAAADHIVTYNPDTDAWSALGTPGETGAVWDLDWDSSGNLYVVGAFEDWAGVAAADWIAKWDGTNWTALATPDNGATVTAAYAIAIDADDNIFVGGDFTEWANDADADYWAWWNGTAWAAVDDIALDDVVNTLVFDQAGTLYVGGDFGDADSVDDSAYIFAWTGTQIEALGSGALGDVYDIGVAPDGMLLVSQIASGMGASGAYLTRWNGSTWVSNDFRFGASSEIRAIAYGAPDPTVPENYNIYLGFDTTAATYTIAGDTTVTNSGSAPVFPRIIVECDDATSILRSIRNNTTGKELFVGYWLRDGETLTIDTRPDYQTSTSSFYGTRSDIIKAGSDQADFCLLPGANVITCYLEKTSSATAHMLWRDAWDGLDD